MKILLLPLAKVDRDPRCQSRVRLCAETANEYAAAYREGVALPRPVAYFDGAKYRLADGFHRVEAARMAGKKHLEIEVRDGTLRDAILHSVGSNVRHGLRPGPEDKRHAVGMMLNDAEWAQWSDARVAERCGVSRWLVADVRRDLVRTHPDAPAGCNERLAERKGQVYAVRVRDLPPAEQAEALNRILHEPARTVACPHCGGAVSLGDA